MKRIFLCSLALLLISGTAFAIPSSVTDITTVSSSATNAPEDLLSYGGQFLNKLEYSTDWVAEKHRYTFDPVATSITPATLTLSLRDDQRWDCWEFAIGWTEGWTWGIGEKNTGDYTYRLGLAALADGSCQASLLSLWGDFLIGSAKLMINYEGDATGAVPVRETANLLLLGTGLFGLAGLSRKKFFNKK